MKIPGPIIAVLVIVVLLFCCTSGLGLQGALNIFSFDSAQDLMSGDTFNFLRPRVTVSDIVARPACLQVTGTGDDQQLSRVQIAGGGVCSFSVGGADTEVRTLPLRFNSGAAVVSFVPTDEDDQGAISIDERAVTSSRTDLNVAVSRSGGVVTIFCSASCSLNIGS